MNPRPLIPYRRDLLPYPETFIREQGEALQNFAPRHAGFRLFSVPSVEAESADSEGLDTVFLKAQRMGAPARQRAVESFDLLRQTPAPEATDEQRVAAPRSNGLL